jgi:CRISPR/Cas system-associated protein endoribonuclease Cas2
MILFSYILFDIHFQNITAIGSIRSTESIRSKIVKIMASYKNANDQLRETGSGLFGIDHSNFQEYIVSLVCKYYFDLLPVLGSRPNVTPAFMNECEEDEEDHNGNIDSDDDESVFSASIGGYWSKNRTKSSIVEMDDNNSEVECLEVNQSESFPESLGSTKRSFDMANESTTSFANRQNDPSSTVDTGYTVTQMSSTSSISRNNSSYRKSTKSPRRNNKINKTSYKTSSPKN